MRFLSIFLVGLAAVACGGISDNTGDAGNDANGFTCNGYPCQGYCIHPNEAQCPTCTALAYGGACPSGSTISNGCPVGPAMPPGQYCITYPPVAQPYCSDLIVNTCLGTGVTPPPENTDVYCMGTACGA